METRTRNDVEACCMAGVLMKGSVPHVKGCPSLLALFCCHLATREFSNRPPAAVGPLRRKQLLLLALPCPAFPVWGNLELVIVPAAGTGSTADLWEGTISFIKNWLCPCGFEDPSEGEGLRLTVGCRRHFGECWGEATWSS